MVIGKVRKVFLKTVKRDVFNKIIKDLKTNFFFNFGHYERCYPDNPQSVTKGFFQMEILQRNNNYVFQIEAVEGNFRTNTNYLSYYDVFEDKKALWFHVKDFFSKHNDLESLSQEVYRKFGFLHPKEGSMLFTQYSFLKNDLPDETSFEDFLDEFESVFKNF